MSTHLQENNYLPSILLIEDEIHLGQTLSAYLIDKGYSCTWVENAQKALEYFVSNKHSIDIILMDVGLPDMSGIDLASKMMEMKNCIVLFLSAQNSPHIRLQGLEIGAYDYITKPFVLKELLLRLNRIYKSEKISDHLQFGHLVMKLNQYELLNANGESIKLTHKECGVLKMLYMAKGNVVSRDEIIDKIWGMESYPSNRTIDNCIVKLRKWTDSDSTRPIEIESVRGIGYKFKTKGSTL